MYPVRDNEMLKSFSSLKAEKTEPALNNKFVIEKPNKLGFV